ncbi:MAG: four-carbon acid sugar kinase family protein [Desulfobacterales bacterium]
MSARLDKSEVKSRIHPSEIYMMADDLAGACDTGIEFLDPVGCVTVVIDSDLAEVKKNKFEGLVVWNTESRSLAEYEAYGKVRRACEIAGANKKRILLKKTDSAFRGHFGREISAVMDALGLELCCLAPAIPDFGRVTRNGIQYLDGLPIAESFYSSDPKQPVTQSRIDEIVSRGNTRTTGLLELETLRSPESQEHIGLLIASGVQVIVVDSESQADLEAAVELFLKRSGPLFFVGGQGLGNALAKYCIPSARSETWTRVPDGAIVIACGTLHPRAREQLTRFSRNHGIEPVLIDIDDDSKFTAIEKAAGKAAIRLLDQIESHGLGCLASPGSPVGDPCRVEEALSLAMGKVYESADLSGLILTGGTTAYSICRRIGVKHIQLRQRIGWGVVLTQAPDLSGMAIAVKGGSLGDVDAIQKIVGTVRSRIAKKF